MRNSPCLAVRIRINATQMLESMTASWLPTRAESTDVANAILDGTDCVMLSGESAMGKHPVESVRMLAEIAAFSEAYRAVASRAVALKMDDQCTPSAISSVVEFALGTAPFDAVFVPTRSGTTARMISRFKPDSWIIAVSADEAVCQGLAFSYGVNATLVHERASDWKSFARDWF
jgi:pyruvate kinase